MKVRLLIIAAFTGVALGLFISEQMKAAKMKNAKQSGRPQARATGKAVLPQRAPMGARQSAKQQARAIIATKANSTRLSPQGMAIIAAAQARGRAERQQQLATYRGTTFRTHPKAIGDDLTIQQAIVAMLGKLDPSPPNRTAHFGWLLDRPDVTRSGWMGEIVNYQASPAGYLVTIRIEPRFNMPGETFPTTIDYFLETYLYSQGQLSLVQGIDPPDAKRGLIFH